MFAKVLKTSTFQLFKSVRVARPWTKEGDNSKLGPFIKIIKFSVLCWYFNEATTMTSFSLCVYIIWSIGEQFGNETFGIMTIYTYFPKTYAVSNGHLKLGHILQDSRPYRNVVGGNSFLSGPT